METDGYLDTFEVDMDQLVEQVHLDYEIQLLDLTEALRAIAHELGGDVDDPRTIVQAAQSARERLNLLMGHWDVPRDADGRSQPFSLVGR